MGFWKKLFGRDEDRETYESVLESLTDAEADIDMTDDEQRRSHVTNCLEQAKEASGELSRLNREYALVTSYLTDIEEVEALPDEEREALNAIANRLVALGRERDKYRDRKNRMKDSDYYRMRKQESEVAEGIEKLRECERYGELVRQDMKRLDREHSAYIFRRGELESMLNNLRGMAVIFLTALAACVVILLVLQFGFHMSTQAGYIISVGAAVIAILFLWSKYEDAEQEKKRVEKTLNKLILIHNKVKIRYVNNKNLFEYLCIKYNTTSAAELEKLWNRYSREKEERREFAETEAKMDSYRMQLKNRMANYRITDPDRWVDRPEALTDPREMVEIRHELILRRQTLRKQMDYNKRIEDASRDELMKIVKRYPGYAVEILSMADAYEDA